VAADASVALVRRFIDEVWNEFVLQSVDEILDEQFVLHLGEFEFGRRGLEFFMGFMDEGPRAMGGMWHYVIEDLIADDDRVAIRIRDEVNVAHFEITQFVSPGRRQQREEETGISIRHAMHWEFLGIFHIRNGKIEEVWMHGIRPGHHPTPERTVKRPTTSKSPTKRRRRH